MEIGERPSGATAQEWFAHLSRNTQNCYQVLAGGRGIFRLNREQVEGLKQPWHSPPQGEDRCHAVPEP